MSAATVPYLGDKVPEEYYNYHAPTPGLPRSQCQPVTATSQKRKQRQVGAARPRGAGVGRGAKRAGPRSSPWVPCGEKPPWTSALRSFFYLTNPCRLSVEMMLRTLGFSSSPPKPASCPVRVGVGVGVGESIECHWEISHTPHPWVSFFLKRDDKGSTLGQSHIPPRIK